MSTVLDPTAELKSLQEEIAALERESAEADIALKARLAEMREGKVDFVRDEAAFTEIDELGKKKDGPRDKALQLRSQSDRIMELLGQRSSATPKVPTSLGGLDASERDVIAKLFDHPKYKELHDSGAFDSGASHIEIPGVEIASREQIVHALRTRQDLFAATLDGQPLTQHDQRFFPPVPLLVRPTRVIDLIFQTTTNSNTIDYVEETTRTDAAAPKALGTAYDEATYVYTPRVATVKDVGHWVPGHRSNLADAGQLEALIRGRLEDGVWRALEAQVISGDGAGQNMTGILNTAGINAIVKAAIEPNLEAIHRGITAIRVNAFAEPEAVAIHPTNYEECVFEKGTDGQYLLGPASQATARTIWGFPAAITAGVPLNHAIPGYFRGGAVLWVRSGITTRISDSHLDFFARRMIAILSEMRAAFAAWVPKYFADVDLTL